MYALQNCHTDTLIVFHVESDADNDLHMQYRWDTCSPRDLLAGLSRIAKVPKAPEGLFSEACGLSCRCPRDFTHKLCYCNFYIFFTNAASTLAVRDTGVVVRQLFGKARKRALAVGFVVHQGRTAFEELAAGSMPTLRSKLRSALKAHLAAT